MNERPKMKLKSFMAKKIIDAEIISDPFDLIVVDDFCQFSLVQEQFQLDLNFTRSGKFDTCCW